MSPKQRPTLLLPALALTLLVASGTFLVAKATLREVPPLPLALYRFVLATAVLVPMTRLLRPHKRIAPADRGRIWLIGLLAVPLNQGLFLVGLRWASASHAALLYALTPAFVVAAGALRGQRPPGGAIVGMAIAFAGVMSLLLQRGLHFDQHSVLGDLVILGAVVAWAYYLQLGRDLTRRYGPLLVTAEAALAGTLLFLPIGLIFGTGYDPRGMSGGAWAGLLYLALLTSALNYVVWYWGLEYLKPGTVALMTNVQPVVAAAMAWFFLHERLAPGFAVSAALVIGGVWIAQRATERARRGVAPATGLAPESGPPGIDRAAGGTLPPAIDPVTSAARSSEPPS